MIRKSLLCGAGAAFLLAGCGRMDQETEFRAALPSKELVETKAPAASTETPFLAACRMAFASAWMVRVQ